MDSTTHDEPKKKREAVAAARGATRSPRPPCRLTSAGSLRLAVARITHNAAAPLSRRKRKEEAARARYTTMYAGYNKNKLQGVRLGNWQEEQALMKVTGYNRGPKPGDKAFKESFAKRVIDHNDQVQAKDYSSTYQGTFVDPSSQDKYVPMASYGSRQAARVAFWAGGRPRRRPRVSASARR